MQDSLFKLSRTRRKMAVGFAATALAVAVCSQVLAGEIQAGEWTGTISPPSGEDAPARFTIGEVDGQIQISISVSGMMLELRDIEVTDDGIMFTWEPGPEVHCELNLQDDDSYAGECTDANGGTGYMTMVPPE